jgi:hypothetical protein
MTPCSRLTRLMPIPIPWPTSPRPDFASRIVPISWAMPRLQSAQSRCCSWALLLIPPPTKVQSLVVFRRDGQQAVVDVRRDTTVSGVHGTRQKTAQLFRVLLQLARASGFKFRCGVWGQGRPVLAGLRRLGQEVPGWAGGGGHPGAPRAAALCSTSLGGKGGQKNIASPSSRIF